MDDSTFKQLRESKYHYPELTDVIFDSNKMLEMALDSMNIAEKGFDSVWDARKFGVIWKYMFKMAKSN